MVRWSKVTDTAAIAAEEYHAYARRLARRYGGCHVLLGPDDIYQIAMISLLDFWRTKPEAPLPLCITVMKRAVLGEMRRRYKEQSDPLDSTIPTKGDVEDQTIDNLSVERIWAMIERLPDRQFQAIVLAIQGHNLMQVARDEGLDPRLLLRNASHARRSLKMWLEESA
jgi:DNA-directed RNA polymerase specialized sigma24 family protein